MSNTYRYMFHYFLVFNFNFCKFQIYRSLKTGEHRYAIILFIGVTLSEKAVLYLLSTYWLSTIRLNRAQISLSGKPNSLFSTSHMLLPPNKYASFDIGFTGYPLIFTIFIIDSATNLSISGLWLCLLGVVTA